MSDGTTHEDVAEAAAAALVTSTGVGGLDGESSRTRPFVVHSEFQPSGDQPVAIAQLTANVASGLPEQTLLGVHQIESSNGEKAFW